MTKWIEIPGFTRYEVSEDGRVRRHLHKQVCGGGNRKQSGELLKPVCLKRDKYIVYCLMSDSNKLHTWPINRFVALAFIGPRPSLKHGALHKNDNKVDNHYTNIYWGTQVENIKDRVRNGHNYFRFTVVEAKHIRTSYLVGTSMKKLARLYGCDEQTIRRALSPNYRVTGLL